MLDPKYLEKFSDQLLGIIDTLTIAIISDMAKRIVKMGNVSESTKHQAEVLQNAGLVYKDTIKRVSQVSGYQKHEVQRMYEEAGVRNLKNEAVYYKQAGKEDIKLNQSNGMQRILQANIRKIWKILPFADLGLDGDSSCEYAPGRKFAIFFGNAQPFC